MTGEPRVLGRDEALGRLRTGFDIVADQAAAIDGAEDDRERRSLLLAVITSAWELRDRATDAYAALNRAADEAGIAKGVIE